MARLAAELQTFLDLPAAQRRIGPFVLVRPLGKGGFAPVWLAEETYGETKLRTAAIKLFHYDRAAISGARSSLGTPLGATVSRDNILEEARALCRVEHPNIVRFYALPTDEARGVVGLAMEYVAGTSLDERLAVTAPLSAGAAGAAGASGASARAQLPTREVLAIGIAVASALAAVHQSGLVHRDVKPANVIDAGGVYKLIDFGIASAEQARRPHVSQAPAPLVLGDIPIEGASESALAELGHAASGPVFASGTLGYIAPECMPPRAEPATAASDLYGLGALLFECVCGLLPAAAGGRREPGVLSGPVLIGEEAAPSLRTVAPEAPEPLVALVDRLLAPDPRARPRSAEQVARELERVRQLIKGRARALPSEELGPFRGLGRFEESDRDVYFGRSAEVAAAIELLRGRGVVALIGPSGSGKSSLGRAGVLPAIADGALGAWPKAWDCVVISPGVEPMAALGAALAPLLELSPEAVAAHDAASLLGVIVERAQASGRGLVLMIDQLEELATVTAPAARGRVVELLVRLGEQPLAGVRAVVAARRDLLDPLLALGDDLGRVLTRGSMLVSPMTDAQWSDALDQALSAYDYAFEDEAFRAELIAELRQTISAMPLVQFALTQLWEQRDRTHHRLTRAGHEAIGGIRGALDRHAEATLARAGTRLAFAHAVARDVLLALTTAQGTRVTRSPEELLRDAGPRAAELVALFEEARLITREPEGCTLAHEALLTQWERLRTWVAEARDDRVLAEEIERDAAIWARTRSGELLWRKGRLAVAAELQRRGGVRLTDLATEFVEAASRTEQRTQRRVYFVGGTLLVATSAAVVALLVANVREGRNTAVRQEAGRARSELDACLARVTRLDNDKQTIDYEKQVCEGSVRSFEQSRDRADERLLLLETDVQLIDHCRKLKADARTRRDGPTTGEK
jgi:serine/threonine protein kinase